MEIATKLTDLIGQTPLIRLVKTEKEYNLNTEILAKLEYFNPAGSAKDRVALRMVEDAEREGILSPGMTLIEPTSGNTGIGLAMVGAVKGYPVILVMPDTMSAERISLMTAYGASIELTPGAAGMKGAVERAEELQKEIGSAWIPQQFSNPSNAVAHIATAQEILAATEGKVDVFVAGIGTGGTITGIGKVLREEIPSVKIIGVEPASSPLLTEGKAGPHGLQGIGANFVPAVLDRDIYDEVLTVTDEDAFRVTKELAHREGLLVGISSGAALAAALTIAKRHEMRGKRITVLFPDTGMRYLSTGIYE